MLNVECNNDLSFTQHNDLSYEEWQTDAQNNSDSDIAQNNETCSQNDPTEELFDNIKKIRSKYMKNVIISHLNVNSLGSKIMDVKELMFTCKFDVLVLSETKLDASFRQNILDIDGYNCIRQDKRSNSGGLIVYISNDIPYSAGVINICNDEIECMSIELNISDEKIMLLCCYKNPNTDSVIFKRFFEETLENASNTHENIVVIGDLNFNMLQENTLSNIMPTFSLTNIIHEVTCYKSSQPTLIDVMLVTKRRKFIHSFSEDTGISDFHNMIGGVLKHHKPVPKTKVITVRSLSKINYDLLISEVDDTELSQAVMASINANDAYDMLHGKLCSLLDKYAPKRQKVIKKNDFHCMSKELRKAMLYRNRLRNKYYKFRSSHYLALYKVQRNHVNAIKRKEIGKYFEDRCTLGTRNKDFWKTVKPLFSKSRTKSDNIPLQENGEIITDEIKVCNIFNDFFQSIGSDIGYPENNERPLNDIISKYSEHDSVKCIKHKIKGNSHSRGFSFTFITERDTLKAMKALSTKKAAGYDELPAQFIKKLGVKLVKPLTLLLNMCILEKNFS